MAGQYEAPITQLLVLGGGIESLDSLFPGQLLPDSPASADSYERAVTAALYAAAHPEITTVIFSGDTSFMMPKALRPKESAAWRMIEVALDHGLDLGKVTMENNSETLFGNFLWSLRHIDPKQKLGLVTHSDCASRALSAGRLVLPNTELQVVYADNPRGRRLNPQTARADRIATGLYTIAMLGVTPGDDCEIERRDRLVQKQVLRVLGLKALVGNKSLY